MLVAPIFHASYLSPGTSNIKHQPSTSSVSSTTTSKSNDASTKYNNIFKSALTRGISFLGKLTNASTSNSNSPASTSSATNPIETFAPITVPCSDSEDSEDSFKSELIFFKPISSVPKTTNLKPKLLRVPSIRLPSSASTESCFSPPCISPFIPIDPKFRRRSAFSVVNEMTDDMDDFRPFAVIDEDDCDSVMPEVKPVTLRALKRKKIKQSPVKNDFKDPEPIIILPEIKKPKLILEKAEITKVRVTRSCRAAKPVINPIEIKTEPLKNRKTRSTKSKLDDSASSSNTSNLSNQSGTNIIEDNVKLITKKRVSTKKSTSKETVAVQTIKYNTRSRGKN
ncbi:unnamed protein product [Diamesa hyperborea]